MARHQGRDHEIPRDARILDWPRYKNFKSHASETVNSIEAEVDVGGRIEVWARTSNGRHQIGRINSTTCWIGSPDYLLPPNGPPGRPFATVPRDGSSSEDELTAFRDAWEGQTIYVQPQLPSPPGQAGDVALLGGNNVIIKAWLDQVEVLVHMANGSVGPDWTEKSGPIQTQIMFRNVAYMLAGQAMELTFKAVYWAESGCLELGGRHGHKVEPLYRALGPKWKRVVDDCAQNNGWTHGGTLATYIDDDLNHVERRYFGVDKRGKSSAEYPYAKPYCGSS